MSGAHSIGTAGAATAGACCAKQSCGVKREASDFVSWRTVESAKQQVFDELTELGAGVSVPAQHGQCLIAGAAESVQIEVRQLGQIPFGRTAVPNAMARMQAETVFLMNLHIISTISFVHCFLKNSAEWGRASAKADFSVS